MKTLFAISIACFFPFAPPAFGASTTISCSELFAFVDMPNARIEPFSEQFPDLETAPKNNSGYKQSRTLLKRHSESEGQSYEALLSDGFVEFLGGLKSNDIFLDGGAGAMRALFDYAKMKGEDSAKLVAIVHELSQETDFVEKLMGSRQPNDFAPIIGKKVEDVNTIAPNSVSLITDVYGAFSYSDHPDIVLQKYLTWLKPGGRLYIRQEVYSKGLQVAYREKREIRKFLGLKRTGEYEDVWVWYKAAAWLKNIEGVRLHRQWDSTFIIEKIDNVVIIPALKINSIKSGWPPERSYTVETKSLKNLEL